MNIVGVDPSLISTAVAVNNNLINYCRESDVVTKNGFKKWFQLCEEYVKYEFVSYHKGKDYSEHEIIKLNDYDRISSKIVEDILSLIDSNQDTIIGIEGYSFSSKSGDIIDLVTFSTLLRKKLYNDVSKNLIILSPSTLKKESCILTYTPIDIGKKKPKLEYRNREGISGGSFTKREMFKSIVENENLTDVWSNHLRSIYVEISEMKDIPKPYNDLCDAYLIGKILSSKFV